MRVLLGLLLLLFSVPLAAQEPRLPGPTDSPSELEALIRRARTLSTSGNHRESAAVWQTVAAREPLIAPLARREAVAAHIAAGDAEATLKGLTELGNAAPSELLLGAADACRGAGALDCAAMLYRRAREAAGRTANADRAALGLAATLERDGRPREALTVYRDLQRTFRTAPAYTAADAAARRLSSSLGNPAPLTESAYAAIVERLAEVAAFRQAADMGTEWLEAFPDTARRLQIESARIQHLYSLRANDEARARAHAFLKDHPDSPQAHDAFIAIFRLDVREGRTDEVETRGRAIMSGNVAGAALRDRQGAARLLAEYLLSVGQPTKALGVYDTLYEMTRTRSARVDVLWRMAIASLRAGNRSRAIKELQQVLRLKPDSETERAASFWLAFAQDAGGAKSEARRIWASLAERHPFSFYGVRAAQRIGAKPPAPSLAFPDLTLSDAVRSHADYRAAALLSRAGLAREAAAQARQLNAPFRGDHAVALLIARAALAADDPMTASLFMSGYFGPFLERPATNLPDDFWELAYPRAYWTEVSAAAARHGVDPLLMIGLSRQESHFNPEARSPVGAVGLFQVMPYTAAELDPVFANPAELERLVQPAVSAELAAKLLASLTTLYGGALAPAIASYNADKERVQVWWEAAKGLPEELFIDSIPYQQTRAYVRQVLTNYGMYQRSARSASRKK